MKVEKPRVIQSQDITLVSAQEKKVEANWPSRRAKSKRFQDGAEALNKVNMWMPPGQVNGSPSKNVTEGVEENKLMKKQIVALPLESKHRILEPQP